MDTYSPVDTDFDTAHCKFVLVDLDTSFGVDTGKAVGIL